MKREKLTLVPVGGLANRMFSVASAYNICRNDGIDLRIIWFRDWASKLEGKKLTVLRL